MKRILWVFRCALGLLAACAAAPAFASAYVFPGTLPAGCSGSSGTYTCGALTLVNGDTLTIGSPTPATITVNGAFSTNNAQINASGSASNLKLVVNGAMTVGSLARIIANVTATSITNAGGSAVFGGSLATTTGNIAIGASSTVAAGITTTTGTISLGTSTQVAQCVQTTGSATLTLGNGASPGGVCCGALGSCSSSCVINNSGAAMPSLCTAPINPATAGSFNAFETGTAANSSTGVIHTKVSGSAFNVAVVVLNTAGTGLATSFAGSVKVELLDSSNNTGTVTAGTGCRSSWTLAAGTTSSTLTFAASDQGRKTLALTVANAWKDARVRISYPATGTATAVGCSNDNFAVRPANFTLSATDATLQTTGTTRTLANLASTGGNVHKAGQPFTLRATAVNGAASPVATSNYAGTPVATASTCVVISPATACTLGAFVLGTTTTTSGVVSATAASYSEAGAFNVQVTDSSFAAVDASDGSTAAEMTITSSALAIGRFVPDHFDVVSLITPVLRTFNSSTCASRSFTYLGQAFAYATPPQASVLARNAGGATTVNYPQAKLNALVVSQAYAPLATATPGLSSSVPATTLPTVTGQTNGTATLVTRGTDTLTMLRPTTTPLAPFNASISLTWSVSDSSETGTGNGNITTTTPLVMNNIAFDSGNEFRFGILKLSSAYGSELINLAVPVELQYWNGQTFATNAADQCSLLPTASIALGNYRGSLAACNTAPGSTSVAFTNGRGLLRMLPPGSGHSGSTDLNINLGAGAAGQQCASVGATATAAVTANLPWLQGKGAGAGATTYSQNPSARISFGQYRSPLIHLQEMY